jgi:hypothetical protein
MRKSLVAGLLLLSGVVSAQVESDRAIELTGGTGQRVLRNLEAPVAGTDAANKDYVDNAVAASGGSGGPTMLSNESSAAMSFGDAVRYCNALNEGGFSDWYLPSGFELFQVASKGGVTVANNTSANYLWVVGPIGERSGNNPGTVQTGAIVRLSDGVAQGGHNAVSPFNVRCVR